MSWWTIIGLFFIVAGAAEFVLFRYVLPDRPGIASKMSFLMFNAGLNVVIGIVLILIGQLG